MPRDLGVGLNTGEGTQFPKQHGSPPHEIPISLWIGGWPVAKCGQDAKP